MTSTPSPVALSLALTLALSLSLPGAAVAHGDAAAHIAPRSNAQAVLPEVPDAPDVDPATLRGAAEVGRWSTPLEWPVLAVHASLLPTGQVLAWDATPDDFDDDPHTTDSVTTRVTLWDPATGTHESVWNDTGADLFCAGSAHLWDGRVLFAGGDSGRAGRNGPLSNSNLFDPWSKRWTATDHLAAPRWYSSVAALPSGEMLTFGGTYSPTPLAEVFRLNRQWRALQLELPFTVSGDYAWLQTSTAGDVAYLGPDAALGMVSTDGDGLWSSIGTRDDDGYRSYGSYALFDIDRALVTGGGDSLASSTVVDLGDATRRPAAPMRRGRRQHNLTILADGQVLASGGNGSGAQFVDPDADVAIAELWDPDTDRWRDMAALPTSRQYHSVALLLPDGRVLSAGGGYCAICGDLGYLEQNGELFSPPYLFEPADDPDAAGAAVSASRPASRPAVDAAPAHVDYGARFTLEVASEHPIERVHLIKLGSVTHSQNQEQRLVPLSFTRDGERLIVQGPADRATAPPGHYMLFAVDRRGVPSIAPIVLIGQPELRADEVVVGRARTGVWDRFEIAASEEHVLTVRLQGDVEALDLYVNANRPPDDVGGGIDGSAPFFDCRSTSNQVQGKLCAVSGVADTRWFIGVKGHADGDYSLVAHVEDGLPDAATLPAPGFGDMPGAPAPPMNARSEALSSSGVELFWDAAQDDGRITGYEIVRNGRLLRVQSGTSFLDDALNPGTRYVYRIIAVDDEQNRSAPSDAIIATTLRYDGQSPDERYHPDIPSAPGGLRSVVYSPTSAELFWQPSYDNGHIVGYEVHRDGQLLDMLDATSYYDGSIADGSGHRYHIVAVDNEGHRSLPSNSTAVNLEPLADPPPETEPGGDTIPMPPAGAPPEGAGPDDKPADDARPKDDGGVFGGGLGIATLFALLMAIRGRDGALRPVVARRNARSGPARL